MEKTILKQLKTERCVKEEPHGCSLENTKRGPYGVD